MIFIPHVRDRQDRDNQQGLVHGYVGWCPIVWIFFFFRNLLDVWVSSLCDSIECASGGPHLLLRWHYGELRAQRMNECGHEESTQGGLHALLRDWNVACCWWDIIGNVFWFCSVKSPRKSKKASQKQITSQTTERDLDNSNQSSTEHAHWQRSHWWEYQNKLKWNDGSGLSSRDLTFFLSATVLKIFLEIARSRTNQLKPRSGEAHTPWLIQFFNSELKFE